MFRTDDELMGRQSAVTHRAMEPQRIASPSGLRVRIKRYIDFCGALFLLMLLLPMFVLVAFGVRLSSPGPIVYSQRRIGLNGKSFEFYKFRSMVTNSEEVLSSFLDTDADARAEWEAYQKLNNDPRITAFGRFIRRTSIDELPQLWNVLIGEMSLVGPRPCMPSQKQLYGPHWSTYCAVRPGLTGLWQISGRNRLTFQERVTLDVRYVAKWSLWLDLVIFLKTIRVVVTGDGSR